jgi:hypothetical protein
MTAEIVILNKEAVALAADSAVTSILSGGHKIFTSADKIFELSYSNPVGIMIYNNASIMGVPWDTVIKVYRKQLSEDKLDYLEDYFVSFITFLEKSRNIFPERIQIGFLYDIVFGYFFGVTEHIENIVNKKIKERSS